MPELMDPLIPGFVAFAGAWYIALTFLALWKSKRAQAWPEAAGQVISSEITEGSFDSEARPTLAVRYEYTCEGKLYRSSEISFFDLIPFRRSIAEELCSRYPAGSEVTVRYNPKNPAEAVLEVGDTLSMYPQLGMGLLALLAGLAFFPWQG